ncbi:hypothetical protein [Paenibacillus sp. YYML68]|uniref:hypothetical protein n=1 Tax=Paenibacillus sp. YYML68 TaxID=2909250 RepID=UPI002491FCE4|nr:hypothetical protein [Paenibacillus sp. YYML68]
MIYKHTKRWLPLIELLAVMGIIFAGMTIWQWSFHDWSPNPLLFVVLYFALRYGIRSGLPAAVLAVLLYAWEVYEKEQDLFFMLNDWLLYKWVVIFLLTGLVVGFYASEWRSRYFTLAGEYEEQEARFTKIEQSYKELSIVKEALEKRIVGAQDSLFTLYKMAKALGSDDSEIIFTDAVRLFKELIGASSIVIYRMDSSGKALRLKVSYGAGTSYPSSVFMDQDSLYRRVCESRLIQLRSEQEQSSIPVMAGPIVGEHGDLIGVIGLNGLDFKTVNRQTVELFRLILLWMGESFVKAYRLEKAARQEKSFPGTSILKPEHFYSRLTEETTRASDFDQQFALFQLPIDFGAQDSEAGLREVESLLKHTLRENDVMTYDAFRGELLFLLPATSPELKDKIEQRIRSRFQEGA